MGIFGDLFDLNGDGQLDSMEKAVEFGAFMQMIDSCQKDELTSAGLDMNELELKRNIWYNNISILYLLSYLEKQGFCEKNKLLDLAFW